MPLRRNVPEWLLHALCMAYANIVLLPIQWMLDSALSRWSYRTFTNISQRAESIELSVQSLIDALVHPLIDLTIHHVTLNWNLFQDR